MHMCVYVAMCHPKQLTSEGFVRKSLVNWPSLAVKAENSYSLSKISCGATQKVSKNIFLLLLVDVARNVEENEQFLSHNKSKWSI